MLVLLRCSAVVLSVSCIGGVSGILLSASGTTARLPGLYMISIGVSASFSYQRVWRLFSIGYVIKCCNGAWSDKTTVRCP